MNSYDGSTTADLNRRLDAIFALAGNDEACRLLGVEGSLEGQLDLEFIDDPLEWLAYDIAMAVRNADASESGEEEEPAPTLATLVGEIRLARLVLGVDINRTALVAAIEEALEGDEDDDEN